ncbi:MAG: T9SS type A sorting domain-containing protein, partial [bacterium]
REMQAQEISITINSQTPKLSELLQSYPNPANNACYIPFKLAKDANVSLEIYNILGQKVRTIELGQKTKGSYTQRNRAIPFDLKNDNNQPLSSGLYFYKLKADDFSAIKSMVVR